MIKEIAIIALAAIGVSVVITKNMSTVDKTVAAIIIAGIIATVASTV